MVFPRPLRWKKRACVEFLTHRCLMTWQGPSGQRPLLMACCCSPVGDLTTVKLLVEAGGNILARPEVRL